MLTSLFLYFTFATFQLALCLPSWDGGLLTRPTTSIGLIVPGADFIEALGPLNLEHYKPKYLSITSRNAKGQSCFFWGFQVSFFFFCFYLCSPFLTKHRSRQ